MDKKSTPPGTGKISDKLFLIEGLNKTVEQCNQLIHSNLTRCTIIVEGYSDGKYFKNSFYFIDGNIIPAIELKTFFHSYMTRLSNAALSLVDVEEKMLQLGNDIISIDDFLKDYSQGNYPSINADDYIKVRDLQLGAVAVISINNSIQSVTRIK